MAEASQRSTRVRSRSARRIRWRVALAMPSNTAGASPSAGRSSAIRCRDGWISGIARKPAAVDRVAVAVVGRGDLGVGRDHVEADVLEVGRDRSHRLADRGVPRASPVHGVAAPTGPRGMYAEPPPIERPAALEHQGSLLAGRRGTGAASPGRRGAPPTPATAARGRPAPSTAAASHPSSSAPASSRTATVTRRPRRRPRTPPRSGRRPRAGRAGAAPRGRGRGPPRRRWSGRAGRAPGPTPPRSGPRGHRSRS